MLRIRIIVCSLFVISLSLVSEAVGATINVAEYANLAVGHGWQYQQSLSSGPWSVQVDSTTTKNGYNVFLLQEYDEQGHQNDQEFIQTDLSSVMTWVGGLNDYGKPTEQTWYWTPPVPRLYASFIPGQSYPFSSQSSQDTLTYSGTLTIIKEQVVVPVGTFSDTWKITQTFDDGSGVWTQRWWYAKGMGLVKRQSEDGNVWELTNYSGFTAPVPEPTSLLLLGSGLVGMMGWKRRIKK